MAKKENLYIQPHTVVSREATEADTDRIIADGMKMFDMAIDPPEGHSEAAGIAHAQITKDDPLRFFITSEGDLVINPIFTNHTKVPVIKNEACTTFPYGIARNIRMKRYHKCEVEYWTIENEDTKQWIKKSESLSSFRAQLFQHEVDHMNGIFIQQI